MNQNLVATSGTKNQLTILIPCRLFNAATPVKFCLAAAVLGCSAVFGS